MVYSFIIADLNERILFSLIFESQGKFTTDIISKLIRRVKNEFDFNSSFSNNASELELVQNTNFETKGILNIKISNEEKSVLWHAYFGCLYILVCDKLDNKLLAAKTLIFLIRTIKDFLPKLLNFVPEIESKADVISIIVTTFLPSGKLQFLNNQILLQITKDLHKIIK